MFSFETCKTFKNIYFEEHLLWTTASKNQYVTEKTIFLFLSQNYVFIITTLIFEALKFLQSFCVVIAFANLCYKNILFSLLCYLSSSELINYHVKTFFPENSSAFSEEVSNRKKDTIKIISINKETETQLQQTAALRSSSSVLASGKSIFHFSKVYNINRDLEPMYSCCLVLYLCCFVLYSCCLMLYLCYLVLCCVCRVALVLSHVVLVLPRVVLCCLVLYSCCVVLLLV